MTDPGVATPPAGTAPHRPPRLSLRFRISVWNAGVIALTLAALTFATAYQERRQLVRTESAHARALLEHLSEARLVQ